MELPSKIDRLSALLAQLDLTAAPRDLATGAACNLAILGAEADGAPALVAFRADAALDLTGDRRFAGLHPLTSAWVGCRGGNPVMRALPTPLLVPVEPGSAVDGAARLLAHEARERRCGGVAAFGRLSEFLIILLLRRAIEQGSARPGAMAGLAHPRISRAMAAMQDAPDRSWSAEDLADRAGMSRSQFMAVFRRVVGETPMGYLAAWRMALAERELARGARVGAVARRCGYASSEAFSRAFTRWSGRPPARAVAEGRLDPG